MNSVFIAIDLKSFYASVECVERQLDPLNTNLVVADPSRTDKTICLAVSPSLKAYGIPGRARLFEVLAKVKEVNESRRRKYGKQELQGISYFASELKDHPELELGFIIAPPRMAYYVEYSTQIYSIYLNYIAPEDMHIYSIDEVFLDVTHYLGIYQMTPRQLASKIVADIYEKTHITATAGIGTNLYLCKVAMDILAKHEEPDENGIRIAQLDEISYRKRLWQHRPLTDFWRVGRGYQRRLEENGLFTMGDVAKCSMGGPEDYYNEELLYKLFGVNAELLIDHAWGYEPTTIASIHAYKPESNSICQGQVLTCPYTYERAYIVVREMAEMVALELVTKRLLTNQLVLTVGYDIDNLTDEKIASQYKGEITIDHYGRPVPKHAHGTIRLPYTSSTKEIMEACASLFKRCVNSMLLIRRLNISADHLKEESIQSNIQFEQLSLFVDYEKEEQERKEREEKSKKERALQEAMLSVKQRYGKNAMLKGMNLQEGATARERNGQIGGHKA